MSLSIDTIVLGPVSANTYIVTDDESGETAIIDCGEFNNDLKSLIESKNVKYILLTHGHFDHILGVPELKDYTHALVAIHTLDADCLENEYKSLASWECKGQQKNIKADIFLNEGDELALGKTIIKVLHTPGHTVGGVCYLIEDEKVIFTGDTLFCLTAGRTDFDGGSYEDLLSSLIRLKRLEGDYTVYTGHNKSTTLDYERTHNMYLRRIK